jgi:hypothetical protein
MLCDIVPEIRQGQGEREDPAGDRLACDRRHDCRRRSVRRRAVDEISDDGAGKDPHGVRIKQKE